MRPTRRAIIITLAALVLAGATGTTFLRAVGQQPKKTDGAYRVTIAGYYAGEGTVDIKNKKITLTGTVRAGKSGPALSLASSKLKLDGDHFAGPADVGGDTVDLVGRIDGYDGDKQFRGARVLCTYTNPAGHTGRIAGVLE